MALANYVKFLRGTPEAFKNLKTKDDDTFYFIKAAEATIGRLYLGNVLIASDVSEDGTSIEGKLENLTDVDFSGGIQEKQVLGYNGTKWIPMTLEDALGTSIIKQTQIFEVSVDKDTDHIAAIDAATAEIALQTGDIAIVKENIISDSNIYIEYTSYVYNGTNWAAMDGNYSAENVYLSKDISFAGDYTAIGNYKKGGDSLKAGTSLQSVLSGLLEKELYPKKTEPKATISVTGNSGEVGTTYQLPTATLTTTVGSYTYGPTTGVIYEINDVILAEANSVTEIATAENKISNDKVEMKQNSTLSLSAKGTEGIYNDTSTKYTFVGQARYSDGAIPLTNLGNEYPDEQIKSGTIDVAVVTATFIGYRKMFVGTLTDSSTQLTSNIIRDFTLVNKKSENGVQTFTVPVGAAKIVIALPEGKQVTKTEYFTMSWEDFSGFTKEEQIQVADARGEGHGLKAYDIWTYTPAGAFEAETQFRITIA